MKIASYWEKINNDIRCNLCNHFCIIAPKKQGICKVRFNKDNTLFTTAYNNVIAFAIDPIEKKPLYHYFPGSNILSLAHAGCNFSCKNCQNYHISKEFNNDGQLIAPQEIISIALKRNISHIAYTYTEPTVWFEYVLETSILAKKEGIRNVWVSNGYIAEKPLSDILPYLDAINVDIKAFDRSVHRKLCGSNLDPVLDNILTLHHHQKHIELTYLLVPEYSDDTQQIQSLCEWINQHHLNDIPLHFSRFFPAYKLTSLPPTPIKHLVEAKNIAHSYNIKYVYIGNAPFDNNTFCPTCNTILIERNGYHAQKTESLINNRCKNCNTIIYGTF